MVNNHPSAPSKPQLPRILALDFGAKNIGLAVSDELGITAQGLDTLERTRIREDLQRLKELAARWDVRTVLVGRPAKPVRRRVPRAA